MDCLAPDTVAAFLAGRLGKEGIEVVEDHLGQCAVCLDLLTTAAAEVPLPRGSVVGRYVVLGLAGRGAMGEVYAAYDPKLDRRVAVKLLRAGVAEGTDPDGAQTRLLREARAIGRLSHPNVVAAYDAGTWEDRVFIAMEFVEGETLADWRRSTSRGWSEIRDVFVGAARGLAAAHAAGLVHRDFKPQNVMVGGDGKAQVTDFGLARRLLTPGPLVEGAPGPLASGTVPMGRGALVGTPSYMAPEQLASRPADARSDQFSFCVALFEALYDQRPFAGADVEELRQAVLSGRVRFPAEKRAVPAWLRRAVLRGLSPEPGDRFPSMLELVGALDDRRPRLRGWTAATIVALLVLVLGTMLLDRWGNDGHGLCQAGRARVAAVWDAVGTPAGATSRRSHVKRAFLATATPSALLVWQRVSATLDRYARRWSAAYTDTCEATHVRGDQSADVLDLRMTCLNQGLDELRSLAELFVNADAPMVANAAAAAEALLPLDRCADVPVLRAVVPVPSDPVVRQAITSLRHRLAEVKAKRDAGRVQEALRDIRPVQAATRALAYKPLLAETLTLAGWLQRASGATAESESTLTEAVAEAEAGRHDQAVAEAAALLAGAISETDVALQHEAERWLALAEAALDRMGPGHDRSRAWILTERSVIRSNLDDFASALRFAEAAVALKERVLGPDHPDVANSLVDMDLALVGAGRPAEALIVNDRALAIYRHCCGDDSTFVAQCLSNRGEALNMLHRHAEAKAAFEGAIARWTVALGPDHRFQAYPLTGLGQALLALGDLRGASAALTRALAIRERIEPNARKVDETRLALAEVQRALGQRRRTELVRVLRKGTTEPRRGR